MDRAAFEAELQRDGCRHSEQAGPDGATYVAGRRKPN
jgi:hypothetical protein